MVKKKRNILLGKIPCFITVFWSLSVCDQFYVSAAVRYTAYTKRYTNNELAFTFPENPPREKVLGNFIVPKNTTVIVDAFAINIRNPFWGPDNRAYRPSRFEGIKQSQVDI